MRKTAIQEIETHFEQMEIAARGEEASIAEFVKPFHLACIAVQARKDNSDIILPTDLVAYAARMGLWEAIDKEPPMQVNRNPSAGRFVETKAVKEDSDVHPVSVDISEMFSSTGSCNATTDALQILAAELLGNCCAHSSDDTSNEIFGMVVGQRWHKGNLAQLCIVDCGIGIRDSLENNCNLLARLASGNACQIATEYGVTGKPHGSHSGYGLALANDLATLNKGNLIVISGNECYVNCEGSVVTTNLKSPWNGTLIIFEWNTNIPLDINQVYDAWPTSESLEEEEQYGSLFDD